MRDSLHRPNLAGLTQSESIADACKPLSLISVLFPPSRCAGGGLLSAQVHPRP